MGGARSSLKATVPENPDRAVFVQYAGFQRLHRNEYSVFTLTIGYMRHTWNIEKRFREISKLDKLLEKKFEREMDVILKPHSNFKNLFRGQDDHFLINRGREVAVYLQLIVDNKTLFSSAEVQEFLEIGPAGLKPDLGRKGKEGYVRVCSGGYTVKHSSKPEFLRSWKWRWVAVNDTQISIYNSRDGPLLATVQIDQALNISCAGKIVIIQTSSRKLSFMTSNSRFANEWVVRAKAFYDSAPRALPQPGGSSYPIRENVDTRVYTTCRDYYLSLAISILRATETIFIAAYTLHPLVTLTRPPFPTIRLDQLLQFKAEQGVQIMISLNKESGSTIGYSSYKSEHTKKHLTSLSPNIEVIRHPGSTKSSWSHHENIVIVDRNVAYVSCAELSYGNYDDANNSVDDEIGCRFPGPDFVQPYPSLHRPVRGPQNTSSTAIGAPVIAPPLVDEIDHSSSGRFDRDNNQPRHHQSFFTSPSALIDGDDDDATVAEPESAQEREARLAAERDDFAIDISGAYPTFIGGESSRQVSSRATADIAPGPATQTPDNPTTDAPATKDSGVFTSLFRNLGDHFSQALADIDALVTGEGKPKGELCLMYPRQPVHSVHAAVSGQSARDIAAHFTQRWNHSRLAKWELDRTHISDVTDNTDFGVCPRCGATGLNESIITCPPCGMALGPKADFLCLNDSTCPHPGFSPVSPDSFTCATYRCQFMGQLGFSLTGDGPVIVHRLLKVSRGHGACSEGSLLSAQGPNVELLMSHSGLKATPGDIIVSVDGITVTHLNTEELTRYIRHRKEFLSQQHGTDLTPMCVVFRRHYVEELHNLPSVVETDSTLYPVAEFEILGPPQAAVAILPESDAYTYNNKTISPDQALNASSDPTSNVSDTAASAPSLLEPVVPQPNGTDAYGMAMALMDAMVTPMPLTPDFATNELVVETESSQRPVSTERVIYNHSEGVQATTTSVISAPPAYNDAVVLPSSTPDIADVSSPHPTPHDEQCENSTNDNGLDIEFPEVPTAPVVVTDPQATDPDYLTRYDLMPLAPTTRPEAREPQPVTGRREVERKAMALSGKGQSFRTRPFEPPTPADSSATNAAASGFSAVSTATSSTTLPRMIVDEGSSISYPNPVASSPEVESENVPRIVPPEPESMARQYPSIPGYEAPNEDSIEKNMVYPRITTEAAPVATGVTAHPYNPSASSRESNAQNCCIIQDIHENVQQFLNPSPAPVPVAVSASDADVHRIMRQQMQHDRPGGVDPARLEKGKKRSLQLEKLLAMSELFHDNKYAESTVSSASRLGHCHVQVLRSSCSWSTGAKKDHSIESSWINAINDAEKFIYIETSTLTGGPMAGSDVRNGIIKALLEKIVSKAQSGQTFRVVIILPLLGLGNFVESEASRVVLQRQYMTICRGPNSLIYQFVQRVPGVDPSEYISFFSLRNWGVMNNKVVSEQVFVKSNVIIVDDRVLVLGSASVTDRGLLGDRNSEVAVRIEDTTHLDVIFNGNAWSVGFLPHMVRTELMRHHLGLPEADLSDPVSPGVYLSLLRGYAALNSGVYDELDGDISVYRCRSISRYRSLLNSKENKSFHDLRVRELTESIKGLLVFFPLDFLSESLPFVNGAVHSSGISLQSLWV